MEGEQVGLFLFGMYEFDTDRNFDTDYDLFIYE